MRDETADWLAPMLEEHIDVQRLRQLMMQAMMPAAEGCTPLADWLSRQPHHPGVRHGAIDWVRYGQLLRHEAGLALVSVRAVG